MQTDPQPINNVYELIEFTKTEGDLTTSKPPIPNGYIQQRQEKETWHFILTSNPADSIIRVIKHIQSYQSYRFRLSEEVLTIEDLNDFVSEARGDQNMEIITHSHSDRANYIFVLRVFHDQNIPIK